MICARQGKYFGPCSHKGPETRMLRVPNKISFIFQLCQETNIYYEPFHNITVLPNTDIYFHIWQKISVKINILLVGNALLSLVNLYAQVTNIRPIFY